MCGACSFRLISSERNIMEWRARIKRNGTKHAPHFQGVGIGVSRACWLVAVGTGWIMWKDSRWWFLCCWFRSSLHLYLIWFLCYFSFSQISMEWNEEWVEWKREFGWVKRTKRNHTQIHHSIPLSSVVVLKWKRTKHALHSFACLCSFHLKHNRKKGMMNDVCVLLCVPFNLK